MTRGKEKCEQLRQIRRAVAEQYKLHYEPAECHHESDCPGTCPVCDAELRDLQCQLNRRGIIDVRLDSTQHVEPCESEERLGGIPARPEPLGGIPAPPYDYYEKPSLWKRLKQMFKRNK